MPVLATAAGSTVAGSLSETNINGGGLFGVTLVVTGAFLLPVAAVAAYVLNRFDGGAREQVTREYCCLKDDCDFQVLDRAEADEHHVKTGHGVGKLYSLNMELTSAYTTCVHGRFKKDHRGLPVWDEKE